MASRIRRCSSVKEFEQVVDDMITMGYVIKNRGENNALLIKYAPKNHLKIFLLTVWFTCGIGNIIYALLPNKIDDEVMVRIEKE